MSLRLAVTGRLYERARTRQRWLAAAGTGMALLYLLFTVGYPLAQHYDVFIPVSQQTKPLFSLADRSLILFDNWVYIVAIAALHLLYLGVFVVLLRQSWASQSDKPQAQAGIVLACSAFCAFVLVWSYPLFSQDVFDYMFQTREWVVYGANPYTNIPDNFRFDPLYKYVSWTQAPNAYGPLWILLTAPLNLLAGDNLLLTIVLYKALAAVAYLGTAWLVFLTLGKLSPRYQLAGTVLFSWNPIMLIEFAGSGHNDVVMLFFMALAVWLVVSERYALSLLALVAGGLVKIVPILLLPFFLLYIWRRLRSNGVNSTTLPTSAGWVGGMRGRPIAYFASVLAVCGAFAIAAYIPFWDGTATLSFLNRGDLIAGAVVFTHVQEFLTMVGVGAALALLIIKLIAWSGFAIFYLRQLWTMARGSDHSIFDTGAMRAIGSVFSEKLGTRIMRGTNVWWWVREPERTGAAEDERLRLMRVCLGVLVFFTLFSSLYYQPWYLTWSLVFLPFMLAPRYKWHVLSLILVSAITTMGFVYF